jgi:hypothetical protein
MAAACSAEQQIRQRVSHGDTIAGEDEAIDGTTNVAIPSSGGSCEADKGQRWEEVWDVAMNRHCRSTCVRLAKR